MGNSLSLSSSSGRMEWRPHQSNGLMLYLKEPGAIAYKYYRDSKYREPDESGTIPGAATWLELHLNGWVTDGEIPEPIEALHSEYMEAISEPDDEPTYPGNNTSDTQV